MTRYIINDLKKSKLIIAALWIVYAASYFIRMCYAASIVSIVEEGNFTKGEVGLIGTAFFICYGTGQLISGLAGDRINPFAMIIFGAAAGSASCFAMAFSKSLVAMQLVWAANGFFQSMLWSPILRIFSETIDKSLQRKAILNISLSLPIGTVCAYFASTLIIKYSKWNNVFICGGFVILAAAVFTLCAVISIKGNLSKEKTAPAEKAGKNEVQNKKSFWALACASGLFIITAPSFLHGMMRDGITSWVPTMITETYGVSASFSVFITIILPIVNAFGAYAIAPIYKKLGRNEMKTSALTSLAALLPLFMLLLIGRLPIFAIIILLALTTSIMYALNYLIVSLVPVRFSEYSCTSTVSGVLNSAAHIGCAVSSYGFGAVSEKFGWRAVVIVWIAAAALTFIFSAVSNKKWKSFIK